MNHDISHCSGAGCNLRAFCRRHKAHKELANGQRTFFSYLDPKACIAAGKNQFLK